MQEAFDTALAGGGDHDFRSLKIHGVEVALVRQPHTGKAGEMIDLVRIAQGFIDEA